MTNTELHDGQTYLNKRGDLVRITAHSSHFFDQYARWYSADGTQVGHTHKSTGNIDLSTAGATEGWQDKDAEVELNWLDQREADERDDEADLHKDNRA